jgi:hypothetical protein
MTGDGSDTQGEQAKPTTKGRGKKNTSTKSTTPATGRRKAEETPTKGPNKKAKTTNGPIVEVTPEEESDDDDESKSQLGDTKDSKKMTDEEKRRNFLERNRYVWKNWNSIVEKMLLTKLCSLALLLSNVVSGRSNGLPTCRPRSKCLPTRMMPLR